MSHLTFKDCVVDFNGKIYGSGIIEENSDWRFVVFDIRKQAFIKRFSPDDIHYDLKLIFDESSLLTLAKKQAVEGLRELDIMSKRIKAYYQAASVADVDESVGLDEIVPEEDIEAYTKARVDVLRQLWEKVSDDQLQYYEKKVWPLFCDIMKIEQSQIHIDEKLLQFFLKRNDLAVHETKFLKHIAGCTKDSFAKTKISPVGSKTWRMKVEGGLQCMSIPHGVCRQVINSRFDFGHIITLDFNAIDYRCLVKAVNDEKLNDYYMDRRDFHSATAGALPTINTDMRTLAKNLTYTHIYGGSIETLQKMTKLPQSTIQRLITVLDELFDPITKFRNKLATEARKAGFLYTPDGHKVEISSDDHDGKIVGLYAQTYSSSVMNEAVYVALLYLERLRSKLIFTVHDELAFDVHPDEVNDVMTICNAIELKTKYAVKFKLGDNYDQATK